MSYFDNECPRDPYDAYREGRSSNSWARNPYEHGRYDSYGERCREAHDEWERGHDRAERERREEREAGEAAAERAYERRREEERLELEAYHYEQEQYPEPPPEPEPAETPPSGGERMSHETAEDRAALASGEIPAHIAMPDLSAEDVRKLLRRVIERAGSQKATAMEAGCSYVFLNDVLHGRREPSGPLLDALGLDRVVTYRPKLRL